MSDEYLSVSELSNYIRDVLRSGFPRAVWVCGEIQEIREKSNHLYFTLSEKDPDSNQVVAKIGATIWANARPKINAILQKAENAFQLKDDIEVKLLCKVDFYPPFGQIRLIVESIDPIHTLGKIAQDRNRLIALLKQKGALDLNKRLAMPRVPLSIGVVTSYDSAAYHDFIDELRRSGLAFKVFIADALMQGKNTESSVVKAIGVLNTMEHLDVLVITRGGGAVAELASFDSEKIAMAIASSRLPVISGIGHEINTTVTDLAAHTFAKTPTAVAQLLVGRVQEFLGHLNERHAQVIGIAQAALTGERSRLKDTAIGLQEATRQLLRFQHQRVLRMMEALKRSPLLLIKDGKRQLNEYGDNLKKTIHLRITNSQTKIQRYQQLIDMADPRNILKRGFSITRLSDGAVVRSVKQVDKAAALHTQLLDGVVISEIKGNKGQ